MKTVKTNVSHLLTEKRSDVTTDELKKINAIAEKGLNSFLPGPKIAAIIELKGHDGDLAKKEIAKTGSESRWPSVQRASIKATDDLNSNELEEDKDQEKT